MNTNTMNYKEFKKIADSFGDVIGENIIAEHYSHYANDKDALETLTNVTNFCIEEIMQTVLYIFDIELEPF